MAAPREGARPGRYRVLVLGTLLAVLMLGLPACSGGGDRTVTIFGPEVDQERENLQDAFAGFTEESGIRVEVEGTRDFEAQIGVRVESGDEPDIGMFPQPALVEELADDLVPLSGTADTLSTRNFSATFTDRVTLDGDRKAVPVKADLKSLVWYRPEAFAEAGYEVPTTLDEFSDLAQQMVEDGLAPFCLGIESGEATGWPLTDWIEDFLLRRRPDLYDRWYRHEIAFDDRQVVEVVSEVVDLVSDEHIYGGTEGAALTGFADAGLPLLTGGCMMHRQGNFYTQQWPDGADVDAFLLPGEEEDDVPVLTGALYAAAFSPDDDVMAVMEFLASDEFAEAHVSTSSGAVLSPNLNLDPAAYGDDRARRFGELLRDGEPIRFDASDRMPSTVGTGTFWEAVGHILTREQTVEDAFADVEASWPDAGGEAT